MKFDDITEDGRLWAVRYDGNADNAFYQILDQWNDVVWLRSFFKENLQDLASYFKITDVNQAIYDTIEDAERLQCLIMDISPEADLDKIFRHLEPNRMSEIMLGKEKAKVNAEFRHASWLRIYAIKLTATMQERQHTLDELTKMEKVRNYLIAANIVDETSFEDYLREL